jgi:hypothetical protein
MSFMLLVRYTSICFLSLWTSFAIRWVSVNFLRRSVTHCFVPSFCKHGRPFPLLYVVCVPEVNGETRWNLMPAACVQAQASLWDICGGQSGTGTGSSSPTSVFPCQYHSTNAPYTFIHLPPTLYNVFLPVLQFSPVSIIPSMLHTHSYIYHQRCIMFLSQYFSFPLSGSFHQCSILIFIYMLLLPEGQMSENWEPSFWNRGAFDGEIRWYFFVFK